MSSSTYTRLPTDSPQPSTSGTSSPTPSSHLTINADFDNNIYTEMQSPTASSSIGSLPLKQKLGYSVGHVLNDLCSAIWFSYLLVYMTLVIRFSASAAGILLLVGQIADGMATPLVGIFSNKINFRNYGKKKFWHLMGSVGVLASFPLIFNTCVFQCDNSSVPMRLLYYSVFISIFQFGWASTQVSHLSLIPDLTPHSNERIGLNSLRFSWTVISSITVYVITWLVLSVDDSSSGSQESNVTSPLLMIDLYLSQEHDSDGGSTIGPKDAPKFRILIISILSIGAFFTLLFHLIVDEVRKVNNRNDHPNSVPQSTTPNNEAFHSSTSNIVTVNHHEVDQNHGSITFNPHLKWFEWFGVPQFYSVGVLYMGTRLVVNLTQVYIPFYLHFTLDLRKESIAYIPLIMYCASFLASLATKYLDSVSDKRILHGFGCLLSVGTYTWMYFGEGSFYRVYGIFILVILLGFSSALMLVISLGITNDLIGHNTSSGAFVFGAMSFLDKLSNGAAVMVIQKLHPTDDPSCVGHVEFYRDVLTYVCGSATLVALFGLILLAVNPIPSPAKSSPDEKRVN